MAQEAKTKVARSARINMPKARLSYPHIFKPTAFNNEGEPKYSASFFVPKSEKEFIKNLRSLQDAAANELYPTKRPQNWEQWGISDGDETDDEAQKGCWVIKASNKSKPRVVDGKGADILDEVEVYGGSYCRASICAKAYGSTNKGGVTLELLVVQKVGDGEPFSGAAKAINSAVDELGAYEESEEF